MPDATAAELARMTRLVELQREEITALGAERDALRAAAQLMIKCREGGAPGRLGDAFDAMRDAVAKYQRNA